MPFPPLPRLFFQDISKKNTSLVDGDIAHHSQVYADKLTKNRKRIKFLCSPSSQTTQKLNSSKTQKSVQRLSIFSYSNTRTVLQQIFTSMFYFLSFAA